MTHRTVCIAVGNKVQTKRGCRNIEDLGLYDKVLTHTGAFCEIANVFRIPAASEVYVISAYGQIAPVICTRHQMFYARTKSRKTPRWIIAGYLCCRTQLGVPVSIAEVPAIFTFPDPDVASRYTLALDNPDYWYLMGYFAGGGTLAAGGSITLTVRCADDVISRLQTVLPVADFARDIVANCTNMGCVNLTWHTILSQFGDESYRRKLPDWVHDAPKKLIWVFLHGYMCSVAAYPLYPQVRCVANSYDFACGLQRLCLKLGIMALIVPAGDLFGIEILLAARAKCGEFAWFPITRIATHAAADVATHALEISRDNSYCVGNIIVGDATGR